VLEGEREEKEVLLVTEIPLVKGINLTIQQMSYRSSRKIAIK
jgi:hypothetical protein